MLSHAEKARGLEEELSKIRIISIPPAMRREVFNRAMEYFGVSDPALKRELWLTAKGIEDDPPAKIIQFPDSRKT